MRGDIQNAGSGRGVASDCDGARSGVGEILWAGSGLCEHSGECLRRLSLSQARSLSEPRSHRNTSEQLPALLGMGKGDGDGV
jgi:hypothetical protein